MKCKLFLLLGLLLGHIVQIFAQENKLHTPADIMKIIEDSKLMYEIGVLEKPVAPPDRSKKVNLNNVYLLKTENGFEVRQFDPSMAARKLADQAEERFSIKGYTQARTFYKEALRVDSSYYTLYTYIGQTYEEEGLAMEAMEWYQKAIDKNPIDYMAHWFLADRYMEQKQSVKAMKHILRAHILNRNNPRIKASLEEICQANKWRYADWNFTPQIELLKKDEKSISVKSDALWMGYALVKSVWTYEPGFKASQGFKPEQPFIEQEEKEALISLHLLAEQEKKSKPIPEVKALKLAVDKQLLNEYIFYEIWLPQYPQLAYQLPEELLESMGKYVQLARKK